MTQDIRKVIFFIPARGGSKGILGKNLQVIGEKSLISIAIGTGMDLATQLKLPVEVVVSSNDKRIILCSSSLKQKPWGILSYL